MYNSYSQTIRTIENPPIPVIYELETAGGITQNAEFYLMGTPYSGSKKGFTVEFLGSGNQVVMHLNPRFKFFEHTVVCNTADEKGKWQKEERHSSVFRLDQFFKLQITNNGDYYKFIVNDKDFCQFQHRIPTTYVKKIKVDGDVRVQKLQLIMHAPTSNPTANYPSQQPPYNAPAGDTYAWQPPPYSPPQMPQPASNPSLGGGTQFQPPNTYPQYTPYQQPEPLSNIPSQNSFYPSLSSQEPSSQNPKPNNY